MEVMPACLQLARRARALRSHQARSGPRLWAQSYAPLTVLRKRRLTSGRDCQGSSCCKREVKGLLVPGDVENVAESRRGDAAPPQRRYARGQCSSRPSCRGISRSTASRPVARLSAQLAEACSTAAEGLRRGRRNLRDRDPAAPSSTYTQSVNVPPTSTPMRFISTLHS